jgi:non-heme chloroperoxidase
VSATLHLFQLTRREMLPTGIAAGAANLLPEYASQAISAEITTQASEGR